MQMTIVINDGVVAAMERRRHVRNRSLEQEINELIRVGLRHIDEQPSQASPFRVEPLEIGECLADDFDDVSALLAIDATPP